MDEDSSFEDDDMVFQKRGEKHLKLTATAEKHAAQITEKSQMLIQTNGHLDPHNRAKSSNPIVSAKSTEFDHFFVKNKFKDNIATAFEALRELLEHRGIDGKDIRKVSDKQEEQIMVIRVIHKVENALNVFLIEDEDTQAKMHIRQGLIWVGMVAAVKAKWQDGMYRLSHVIDLSEPIPQMDARLAADLQAYRMMIIRGPFRPKFGHQDPGIIIMCNQIKKLNKFSMKINCVMVMGPLLPKNNRDVENCSLPRSFQEEYEIIIQCLRRQLNKIDPAISLFVLPSVDDVVSLYPIPQPAYQPEEMIEQVRFLSNPSTLTVQGRRSNCKMNLINYDLIKYMDRYKGGHVIKDLLKQNLQSYLKQPFLISNSLPGDPFDQVNIGHLYNGGQFGQLIIFSSQYHQPYTHIINGRMIVNVGSLGVDFHDTGKHYMVILSIFEGEGPAAQRTKVQSIVCS